MVCNYIDNTQTIINRNKTVRDTPIFIAIRAWLNVGLFVCTTSALVWDAFVCVCMCVRVCVYACVYDECLQVSMQTLATIFHNHHVDWLTTICDSYTLFMSTIFARK